MSLPHGLHPKRAQFSNSIAGCCITPMRRETGRWQDTFECLLFFFGLFFLSSPHLPLSFFFWEILGLWRIEATINRWNFSCLLKQGKQTLSSFSNGPKVTGKEPRQSGRASLQKCFSPNNSLAQGLPNLPCRDSAVATASIPATPATTHVSNKLPPICTRGRRLSAEQAARAVFHWGIQITSDSSAVTCLIYTRRNTNRVWARSSICPCQ